ncbi:MAG: transcriptional regulator, TetR family protein [Solirubrobacterales bacterium]|nr:transcriptional regulator, TetR family protein [Solirubrobacterales bacterium]
MSDASPRSRQGRAYQQDEVAGLLRDALTALMADGTPFRDLSVARLASTAGLARSTFYVAYDDKAAMLQELSARSLSRLYGGARAWIRHGGDATREDIAAGMRQILDAFLQDEAVMRAVAEASVYEPAVRTAYVDGVNAFAGALERMIRRGVKAGRMRAVAPRPTAEVLAWMTERTISRVRPDASSAELDALAVALADVVWQTLFAGT